MRVAILVDTPNITRSVHRRHGTLSLPDYHRILEFSASIGKIAFAKALVNDGLSKHQATKLSSLGFTVVRSHAFDCDDALVSWAVRICFRIDCLLLCSGDKHFRSLVRLLQTVGKMIIVCAVEGSCNRHLKEMVNRYVEIPILGQPASGICNV